MGVVPDERLARRAARGDRRAFEAIYRRYGQPLYRFCLAMVGNPQDAQDALQNTMVKALRALPGEERQIQLKPWLYRIARNESVEVLRRRREGAALDPEQEAAGGVAETAEARERLRHLLDDLEQLPERQRSVLLMRELSGLGFDQIGAALDTSAAAARQALYEARLSLRQMEAGREMRCADVMKELSDADGRVVRRREIRTHLRGCAECRAFQEAIGRRHGELAAIAPLPLATSAALLQGVLGAKAGVGAASAGAGAVATSAVVKSVATVAVATVISISAADRGGLVDLPLPGDRGGAAVESALPAAPRVPPAPRSPGRGDNESPAPKRVPARAAGVAPIPRAIRPSPGADSAPVPAQGPLQRQASPSARSAGANPPGGGHGSAAAARRGRPGSLPPAAARGQGTAATRRPSHAGRPASPGRSASPPQAKVVPQPKPPPPPPHPLAPPEKVTPPTSQPSGKPEQESSLNEKGAETP